MKKIASLLIFLLLLSPIVVAKDIYNYSSVEDVVTVANMVKFKTAPTAINLTGLKITPISPTGGFEKRLTPIDKKKYYTDGYIYVGVDGVKITFTNETDKVVVIHWRDSVMSVDNQSYGMPYVGGMPYRDAGNPSATPNTVIPPKQSSTVTIYLSTVSFFNGSWYHYPTPIPRGGSVKLSCYIKATIGVDTSYISLEMPPIFIDTPDSRKNIS